MSSRMIPCTDCTDNKRRLERAGFVVEGCDPEGADGMCRITFHDPKDAIAVVPAAAAPSANKTTRRGAARSAPLDTVTETPIALAAGSMSPAWDFSVPPAATAVVKRIEGFFATPYDDNGARPGGTWTIGYGTIIDASGNPVTPATPPITEADAENLLRRDMEGAARDVRLRVKVPLAMCEAAALISWTYNLGGGSLGKSTMLTRINANLKAEVPAEMRKWINQENKPLVGLLRRRWAESAIFIGLDPTNACVRAWREIDSLDDWPEL